MYKGFRDKESRVGIGKEFLGMMKVSCVYVRRF